MPTSTRDVLFKLLPYLGQSFIVRGSSAIVAIYPDSTRLPHDIDLSVTFDNQNIENKLFECLSKAGFEQKDIKNTDKNIFVKDTAIHLILPFFRLMPHKFNGSFLYDDMHEIGAAKLARLLGQHPHSNLIADVLDLNFLLQQQALPATLETAVEFKKTCLIYLAAMSPEKSFRSQLEVQLPTFDAKKSATYYPKTTKTQYFEAVEGVDNWLHALWDIIDNQLLLDGSDQKLIGKIRILETPKREEIPHFHLVNDFLRHLEYIQKSNTKITGKVMSKKLSKDQL